MFDTYRRNWPRVGAVEAMALGGAGVLGFTRKKPGNLRALAVMNSMTMSAHQYKEYVDPGYFPGPISRADWAKSAGVLAAFFAAGVIAPNAAFARRDSPYAVSDVQLGKYGLDRSRSHS
ncbi:hypothetical protein [Nocardioides sp. Kera G14]|uniref:hypothetical protein n=1 Tax=Nocardioides sp. Kera G14 TaxID=2884264 RepID=UPI001D0FCB11|nr:hypothetical protein [Nocardioides sp. Kera G14]UDY25005.1 hypothetical protein LH076_06845 [Nocardioides sp. Kera G14]